MAGCWPKLRLNRIAWTRSSPACSRSMRVNVPSSEPSSTKISSHEREPASSAVATRR